MQDEFENMLQNSLWIPGAAVLSCSVTGRYLDGYVKIKLSMKPRFKS